ncbi:MAG: hypothetical protein NTV34_02495 [Proteobacteria bacterium]|nr:hypothetical protein [Pseudomonadota bacterium]
MRALVPIFLLLSLAFNFIGCKARSTESNAKDVEPISGGTGLPEQTVISSGKCISSFNFEPTPGVSRITSRDNLELHVAAADNKPYQAYLKVLNRPRAVGLYAVDKDTYLRYFRLPTGSKCLSGTYWNLKSGQNTRDFEPTVAVMDCGGSFIVNQYLHKELQPEIDYENAVKLTQCSDFQPDLAKIWTGLKEVAKNRLYLFQDNQGQSFEIQLDDAVVKYMMRYDLSGDQNIFAREMEFKVPPTEVVKFVVTESKLLTIFGRDKGESEMSEWAKFVNGKADGG